MDYKKYSLEQLENWVHDAISCSEASPQEIYDVIKKVVEENYYIYKNRTEHCYELLALLNGNGKFIMDNIEVENDLTYDKMVAAGYEMTDDGFWVPSEKEEKVNKWVLPVEIDDVSGEYYIQLPNDILDILKWEENDKLEYVNNNDGSFTIKKVS